MSGGVVTIFHVIVSNSNCPHLCFQKGQNTLRFQKVFGADHASDFSLKSGWIATFKGRKKKLSLQN